MKRILAIDPGASGGVVELYPNGRIEARAMPDDPDMVEQLSEWANAARTEGDAPIAYMELVSGYIGPGSKFPGSAMFNFGDGYGYIRGLLAALRVPLHLTRPQEWQAGIPGVRGQKEKAIRKRALKEHAARLFPSVKVTLKTADALCIADYAARREMAPMPPAPVQTEMLSR